MTVYLYLAKIPKPPKDNSTAAIPKYIKSEDPVIGGVVLLLVLRTADQGPAAQPLVARTIK